MQGQPFRSPQPCTPTLPDLSQVRKRKVKRLCIVWKFFLTRRIQLKKNKKDIEKGFIQKNHANLSAINGWIGLGYWIR